MSSICMDNGVNYKRKTIIKNMKNKCKMIYQFFKTCSYALIMFVYLSKEYMVFQKFVITL